MLRVQTKYHTRGPQDIGLGYFKYGLCALCFDALTTVCSERADTLAENRCIAHCTDDGVHAAAMLSSAYRAGAECRLSQADAAWVRNVIADSENFLPCLICFVKCHNRQPDCQQVFADQAVQPFVPVRVERAAKT